MNAELLLRFVLGCDRAYLFAHPERELTSEEIARYDAVLAERARGVPAQYITGHQEFWGMDFVVTPAVLIPRPETEHLIEAALQVLTSDLRPQTSDLPSSTASERSADWLTRGIRREGDPFGKLRAGSSLRPKGGSAQDDKNADDKNAEVRGLRSEVRLADVGTGSGCIALALAKELPRAEIHATDISAAALEVARANAARLQLEGRVQFHQTDLLAGLDGPFDVIVSNPPYVGESEEDEVQLEVRKFEPRSAVFAGPVGTEVIARLIPQAEAALRPGGWLILEISGTIAAAVRGMLQSWDAVETINDLQSIPRVVRARKKSQMSS
jgi:release factor glutamine methyltransferase